MLSYLEYGFRNKRDSEGGSVARASDAKVSIIRLTHNICTGFRGEYFRNTAPVKAMIKATTLTVSWNWMNFLMQSKMFLPHLIAVTILN